MTTPAEERLFNRSCFGCLILSGLLGLSVIAVLAALTWRILLM